MQVVYVDTLFLLNLAINYALLLGTGRFSGLPYKRLRLLLAALAGAAYAVAVCIPDLRFLNSAPGKIAAGIAMVLIGFGFGRIKQFLKYLFLFFLVALIFGGGVMAIYIASGGASDRAWQNLSEGVLYSHISLRVLIISVALCYGVVSLFFDGAGRHGGFSGDAVRVKITDRGKTAVFTALMDTGNTLRDPVTNSPVLIAEPAAVAVLLPREIRGLFDDRSVQDPAGLMEALSDMPRPDGISWAAGFRLIPYRTVGKDAGMLLSFRPEKVEVGGKPKKGILIAFAPTEISEGAGYSALIGSV